MKLFTPAKAKEEFKSKQGVDIVQIAYLDSTLKKLQEQINRENDNWTQRMKEQREAYGAEKIALRADLRLLEDNVKALRKERKELMVPINTLKAEVQEMHNAAQLRLKEINLKESELDDKIELVKVKLDELSERELNILETEEETERKKIGAEREALQVSESHQRLNLMISTFNQEVDKKTKELNEIEERLKIEKKMASEYLELRIKELAEQERGLVDRRQALEREFTRLNKKNGTK